jgi:hypothetical protein
MQLPMESKERNWKCPHCGPKTKCFDCLQFSSKSRMTVDLDVEQLERLKYFRDQLDILYYRRGEVDDRISASRHITEINNFLEVKLSA